MAICCYCNKKDAVKRYFETRLGKKSEKTYCLDCYHKLFLYTDKAESGESLSACPYCGTTAEEFKKTKLVGCAYCYRTMAADIAPIVIKMQDKKAHCGKAPPLDFDFDPTLGKFEEERRAEAVENARLQRQCTELEIIIKKLMSVKDYVGAKGYGDKLSQMKTNARLEEDFVWRERTNAQSKRQ